MQSRSRAPTCSPSLAPSCLLRRDGWCCCGLLLPSPWQYRCAGHALFCSSTWWCGPLQERWSADISLTVMPSCPGKDGISFLILHIPPASPCMASSLPAAQRVLCSNCARPWSSAEYKTCDDCRNKATRRRQLRSCQPAAVDRLLSTPLPQPPLTSSTATTSEQREFCSRCARPWHSLQYKTCDRCRARSARGRPFTSHQSAPSNHQSSSSLQAPSLPAAADASAHRVLCSRCARSWHSLQYRTCDGCRARSVRSRPRASPQSAPSNHQPSPSLQAPFLPATADASAHRVLCSSCA